MTTIILLLGSHSSVFPQKSSSLYLLMAFEDDYERDSTSRNGYPPEFYKVLFKVAGKSLIPIDTLNFKKNVQLDFMVQFKNHRFIYFQEDPFHRKSSMRAPYQSILDYDGDSLVLRKFDTTKDSCHLGFLPFGPSIKDENEIWFSGEGCRFPSNPTPEQITASRFVINRRFERKPGHLKLSDYQKIYNAGRSSPHQGQFYSRYTSAPNNSGPFKTIGYGDDDYRPDAWVQPPASIRDSTVGWMIIDVSDEEYFIASANSKTLNKNGFPNHYVYIYEKEHCNWSVIKTNTKEHYTIGRNEDWIYGTGLISWDNLNTMAKQAGKSVYDYPSDKENLENYDKYYSKNGGVSDLILQMATGKLMLYHIPSETQLIWETKDKDSEIIDMIDGSIYYRIYDELRTADVSIGQNGIKIKNDRMIVKDKDIIPYVHHLFLSKTKQNKFKRIEIKRTYPQGCFKCKG